MGLRCPRPEQECQAPAAAACGFGDTGEAGASPQAGAAPAAWLQQQQACCLPTVCAAPFMHIQRQSAAALWRSMWLHGLQFHNAARSGQPIRPGSTLHFIPLDPNDDLLSVGGGCGLGGVLSRFQAPAADGVPRLSAALAAAGCP